MNTTPLPSDLGTVHIDGNRVTVANLTLTDQLVAGHLEAVDSDRRVDEVVAALAIGVRGLGAMGSGAAAHRVGEVVDRLVDDALSRTEVRIAELLDAGRREMSQVLDPEVRSSITARMITELDSTHRQLLDGLDPDRRDSRTARFVAELEDLLGPEGQFERRLAAALDPTADDSAFAAILRSFEDRFQELRDLVVGSVAQSAEASRGTAKGFDFEDVVEARLRVEGRHLAGAIVERTSLEGGALGANAIVGDCVVTLPDTTRIVVEAKHTARIGLAGKDGILAELDRAMANRNAAWALCVSHDGAYPEEVGVFGIYGNRVLVVDNGSGELIRVALRWIAAAARHATAKSEGVDTERIEAQLERIRSLATRFSRAKRALSAVQSSIEAVRCELDDLRSELLDGVEDTVGELRVARNNDAPTLVA